MVTILDYGVGNLASVANMLKKIGEDACVTSQYSQIKEATKIILPGVGHFDSCMRQLRAASFFNLINERVQNENIPVLGVCAGCQMLMESSDEGVEPGLGWIKGKVVKFDNLPIGFKVPHMGWSDLKVVSDSKLFNGIIDPRFYFVHSYHLLCENPSDISSTAEYGYEFAASVAVGNIMGVQFHPEKSHKYGMKLLENFVKNYS